jgi:peptidoglycan hydrolase CwlO-like protein
MKKTIITIVFAIFVGVIVYLSVFKSGGIIDTNHYQKTIDSLNESMVVHHKEIDSLNASIAKRDAKIDDYNNQLANLKNKLNKEKKSHEADINRINTMSNSDLTSEFANAFKD